MRRRSCRAWAKVETIATDPETGEETSTVTLHRRYIYRGYLQVAACDLTRGGHPCLWLITWDPTQPMATRPLAIQKDGTWYCYGWDLTKNVCEVFGQAGYIRTTYSYTPYGSVTEEGDVTQPLQWSSEYGDPELGLIYYNYRYYNPADGRWIRRDLVKGISDNNLYLSIKNSPVYENDYLGLLEKCQVRLIWGHHGDVEQYMIKNKNNYDAKTCALGPMGCFVSPAPSEWNIKGFPDFSRGYLGIRDRGDTLNPFGNAGLNPNLGKTENDRKQGFCKVLKRAFKKARKEAERICKKECCRKVKLIFLGIGARNGQNGTNILRKRLLGTPCEKDLEKYSSNMKETVPCNRRNSK